MNIFMAIVLVVSLLMPFFAYGVYNIYQRFRKGKESTILTECITILLLIVYVSIQIHYIGMWRYTNPIEHIISVLGLLFATFALYGHVVLSLFQHIFMDLSHPRPTEGNEPRWGEAESFERVKDYEGALAEYFKLTKHYPYNAALNLRIAEALVNLKREAQAIPYYRMALGRTEVPQRQLEIVNRLCDLYTGSLNEPDRARNALGEFIEKNPGTKQAETAQLRLERIQLDREPAPKPPLETLEEHPVEEQPRPKSTLLPSDRFTDELDALDDFPLTWSSGPDLELGNIDEQEAALAASLESELMALGEEPLEDEEVEEDIEEDNSQDEEPGSSLERM